MSKIKTFEKDLKPGITLQFINFLVELAEGFEYDDEYENWLVYFKPNKETYIKHTFINDSLAFPLLLHRAVEGWNNKNVCKPIQILCNCVSYITDEDDPAVVNYGYDNEQYLPCHLTACEMTIMDCLAEVLK